MFDKWKSIYLKVNVKIKVKVGPIYDPCVREVPVREDTCPGPSTL